MRFNNNNLHHKIKEHFKKKYFKKKIKINYAFLPPPYPNPPQGLSDSKIFEIKRKNFDHGFLYAIDDNAAYEASRGKKIRRFIRNYRHFIPIIGHERWKGQVVSRTFYPTVAFVANWHSISRFRFLNTFKESLGVQLRKMRSFFFSQIDMHKVYRKRRYFSDFLKKKLNLLRMRLFYGIFYHSRFFKFLHDRAHSDDYQSHLYSLMERRLDVLLFRIGFVSSIYLAQQMVRHGKVRVGNRVVRNFYAHVKFFEKVYFTSKVVEDEMKFIYFLKLIKGRLPTLPSYLIFDFTFFFFYVRPIQSLKEIKLPFNLSSRHLSVR